ncbi:pilus assembly protein [bacterium]|nr:MAG: pilus assembly protein [bacterium]
MRKNRFLNLGDKNRCRSRRRGQALVEFGLIAAIFLTMLLGMMQFGMYQSTANSLWNLSREGARFASVGTPTDADIINRIKQVTPPNIAQSNLTIEIYPQTTRTSGSPVAVCLTYNMADKIIFPVVGKLLSRNRTIPAAPPAPVKNITGYNYYASSIMRVE